MASMNRVQMIGNLTGDPELRNTASGTAVCSMRLAVNEKRKSGDDETLFVDVTAWERQAETCAEYLSKGSPVLVEGRLILNQWEDKKGNKRSKHSIVANRVQFLSTRAAGSELADAPAPTAPVNPAAEAADVDESDSMPF